jgi:predicted RNA-binding protein with EMAP domain
MQTESTTTGEKREELRRSVEKLYELADSIEEIYESTGGEIDWRSESLQRWIDESSAETVEALCQFITQMEAEAKVASEEIRRVGAFRERCTSRGDWAARLLLDVLRKLGVRKVDVGTWHVGIRKGAASVKQREGVEIDLGLLDPALVRDIPAKQEPDKKAIRAALERGEEVAGFYIAFGEEYVVVK